MTSKPHIMSDDRTIPPGLGEFLSNPNTYNHILDATLDELKKKVMREHFPKQHGKKLS